MNSLGTSLICLHVHTNIDKTHYILFWCDMFVIDIHISDSGLQADMYTTFFKISKMFC